MFRIILLTTALLLFYFVAKGQMRSNEWARNLGPLYNYNNDTAYFYLTNSGPKTVYFLPVQPGDDFQVLCNTKTIVPGEVMTIGIIYYTEKRGKFNLTVPLYFSDSKDPLKLVLSGNIKSISPNALTICPSIENSKPLNHTVPLNIVVRDMETNEQIKNAKVTVEQGRKISNCVPGFQSMAFQCNCSYGKMKVGAESDGYQSSSVVFDFYPDNNTCVVYLIKKIKDTVEEAENRTVVVKMDTAKEEVIVYEPAGKKDREFNSTVYKPNHLIFVIDVSGSMKDSVKLGYLKKSIKALIGVLRPQDYITLITYSSKPKIVFENLNGLSKSILYETIDSLHAKGGSVGSDALSMAYDMAHRHFIEGGNNQIFLATDGLFSGGTMTERDIFRMVKYEYVKNAVKLTTIAFGKNDKALAFLSEMAAKGSGQSLSILHMPADQEILIEEVKAQSLK